jgi:hypothetical protein
MYPYILSLTVFILLLGAFVYYDAVPSYEVLRKRMVMTNNAALLLLLLLAVTAANSLFLSPDILEQYIAALMLWLNFVFILLLCRTSSQHQALLLAIAVSEVLVLFVYFFGEYANNLSLSTGIVAAVTLLQKSGKVTDRVLLWLLVVMTAVDATFVWIIPMVPAIDAGQQSLVYSLLLKVGSVSLGAGDVTLLLIAAFLLGRREHWWPLRTMYAFILSLCVIAAYFISMTELAAHSVFPFTVVLTPITLLVYFVVRGTAPATMCFLPEQAGHCITALRKQ